MYRELYKALYANDEYNLREPSEKFPFAADFLETQLSCLGDEVELDDGFENETFAMDLIDKMHARTVRRYETYITERENGSPRSLFPHLQSVQWFLLQICPTKMVDGIWLSTANQLLCGTALKNILQKTYYEECGEGSDSLNHVSVFRKLFESAFKEFKLDTPDDWISEKLIEDQSYRAGAIQMALAICSEKYLPELVGYNLGYEQLPFHMLVTVAELKELQLDPYYFTLHVTVDNAHTGHAAMAKKAVTLLLDDCRDETEKKSIWRRIQNGYALSSIGVDTEKLMKDYSLEKHADAVLKSKCEAASGIHRRIMVKWNGENCSFSSVMDHCSQSDLSLVQALKDVKRMRSMLYATKPGKCMYKSFDADELEVLETLINGK